MKMLLAVMIVSVGGLAAAMERPRLRGREAPRATDLLRAATLADQTEKRLRLPAPTGSGWKHGGRGWESAPRPAPESRPVTIRVTPPKRRASAAP